MDDADEFVDEFIVETHEHLDRLDRDLIALEKNPTDRATLSSIFRTIHTVKGTSGFLAFDRMAALAHVGENLLGRLRDGRLALNPEIATALLRTVDGLRQMLASVEKTGAQGRRDDSELISTLMRLQRGVEAEAENAVSVAAGAGVGGRSPDVVAAANGKRGGTEAGQRTIRLDVELLDRLLTLVGELALARNQILQFSSGAQDGALLAASQRLNVITGELQDVAMKTRMQPIGSLWRKLPRIVRDLALACGKQVRVEMEGEDTQLHKTLIEAMKDPLTHIVRNSVDHGIETPEVRRAAGKDPEGRLELRAFYEGGEVNIEVSDDGAGLDSGRIREKALEKRFISAEQARQMSDSEILNLIFLPGFSAAERVTSVSGRGVGMDVVKTNLENIGGTVELQSKLGCGTVVRMKFPLTVAITALIGTSAGERYAVPEINLVELVEANRGAQVIEGVNRR